MPGAARPERLRKELGLFDVYAISTGAMFSSGFFLLPGLAAAQAGPSVVLAYGLAGLLILPAMFSMAELSTAMPRAGGAYYFLDRSLGPMIGTVGGLGTFLALTLKSAFALIGMGAYLAIFVELPIKPLAVALTFAFMGLNIFGAKETTGLQRILVIILLSVLAFFTIQGLGAVFDPGYRSPLYPWMQVFGIVTSLLLIVYMGWLATLFTVGIVVLCLAWYFYYARPRVVRDGAIYHWFERMGRRRYDALDRELRGILKEKGLRREDPFDDIVARSVVLDLKGERTFDEIVEEVAVRLSDPGRESSDP